MWLRWFGHLGHRSRSGNDWVLTCRNVEVSQERDIRAEEKDLGENVNDDMKLLGLYSESAVLRDMWRGFISRQGCGKG